MLVIEDDPLNREILERHLTRQGYQVLMAKGDRQALEMLAAARVDVVLLLNARLSGCIGRKRLRDREVRALQNRVFQRMAQLQTRQQDVDALVAERTRPLEDRIRALEQMLDEIDGILGRRRPPAAR